MNLDGQGNPIRSDGKLFAPWMIEIGWDMCRQCYAAAFYWNLRTDAQPGEHVYRREARVNFLTFFR